MSAQTLGSLNFRTAAVPRSGSVTPEIFRRYGAEAEMAAAREDKINIFNQRMVEERAAEERAKLAQDSRDREAARRFNITHQDAVNARNDARERQKKKDEIAEKKAKREEEIYQYTKAEQDAQDLVASETNRFLDIDTVTGKPMPTTDAGKEALNDEAALLYDKKRGFNNTWNGKALPIAPIFTYNVDEENAIADERERVKNMPNPKEKSTIYKEFKEASADNIQAYNKGLKTKLEYDRTARELRHNLDSELESVQTATGFLGRTLTPSEVRIANKNGKNLKTEQNLVAERVAKKKAQEALAAREAAYKKAKTAAHAEYLKKNKKAKKEAIKETLAPYERKNVTLKQLATLGKKAINNDPRAKDPHVRKALTTQLNNYLNTIKADRAATSKKEADRKYKENEYDRKEAVKARLKMSEDDNKALNDKDILNYKHSIGLTENDTDQEKIIKSYDWALKTIANEKATNEAKKRARRILKKYSPIR